MKPSKPQSIPTSYLGHVKNGVVLLDDHVPMSDGQVVRVEPVVERSDGRSETERGERVRYLKQLFAEWNEEDGKLTDEEADRLEAALASHARLTFRPANVE